MEHALHAVLHQGHQHVAIVGSDIPDLRASHVSQALKLLNTCQVS
jgi:2-phospho-L-lactate guanylyltransferase (CobY/MobA/RfbA family)